jgi:hypothetical protein
MDATATSRSINEAENGKSKFDNQKIWSNRKLRRKIKKRMKAKLNSVATTSHELQQLAEAVGIVCERQHGSDPATPRYIIRSK